MTRLFLILMFSVFLFSGFTDKQVWVKASMPLHVNAGESFTIKITINKLNLQHFAEYRQSLPKGFTAIEKHAGASEFSFKDQSVRFTWVRLPREPKITISYEVKLKEELNGKFTLPGQFTYLYKNQRGIAVLENDVIHVHPKE